MQLVESYFPVFYFIAKARNDNSLQYDVFRTEILRLLAVAKNNSLDFVDQDEDHIDAHYAVTVWLDEIILRSSLDLRHQWRDALLQTEYYQTALGGEFFFTRLDNIPPERYSVRNVFLVCLLMGFQGKYTHLDKSELAQRINAARQNLPPEWRRNLSDAEITPMVVDQGIKKTSWRIIHRHILFINLVGLWLVIMMAIGLAD